MSGGHFFINSHALSEAKNNSSIYSTNKRDGNVPNVSEMEDNGLQYGVDINYMLSTSTLHQYDNMEWNNESCPPLMNGKFPPSKNSSVLELTSPSVTSINDEVCSKQNTIHKKIKYSDSSKT